MPRPRAEVYAWFSDAANLAQLTPPAAHFELRTPLPIAMREGTRIEHRVRVLGLPVRWLSLIEVVEPGVRFVDRQLRGPFRAWRHAHEFRDAAGGTEVRDVVDYDVGWGPLGAVAHAAFVERQLREMFDYRGQRMRELFSAPAG